MATDVASPAVADPVTCGEDVAGNLKRLIEIAPKYCPGCEDYHIFNTAKRLAGFDVWSGNNRQVLLDTLKPLLAEAAARQDGPIDVVAAACADTAVLATAVHAAWLAGDQAFRRSQYTVVDICRTPLVLCEEYGVRHGLPVATGVADLLATRERFPADVLVLHNFLSFVGEEDHAGLLSRLGRWLKEGGNIVIWNMLAPDNKQDAVATRWEGQIAEVRARVEDGRIEINEPEAAFLARLSRDIYGTRPSAQQFADLSSVTDLVASSGLDVRSAEELSQVRRGRTYRYAKIVAERRSP